MYTSIQNKLISGEKILWQGQPSKKWILDKSFHSAIKFTIAWICIMFLISYFLYFFMGRFNVLHLIVVPFFIIGFFLTHYIISLIIFKINNMFYCLTNKRIIIYTDKKNTSINSKYLRFYDSFKSIALKDITSLDIDHTKGAIGNVYVIGKSNNALGFYNVENASEFFQLISKQDEVHLQYIDTAISSKAESSSYSDNLNNLQDEMHSLQKEEIIWTCKSTKLTKKYSFFSHNNLPFLFFGLVWLSVIIFATCLILTHNPQVFIKYPIITIFFIISYVVGYYYTFIAFRPLDNKKLYIITNKKIIINSDSYHLNNLKTISVQINKNNTGNIYFNLPSSNVICSKTKTDHNVRSDICFYSIKNPVYVYNLIRQQMNKNYFPNEETFYSNSLKRENNHNVLNLLLKNEKIIWTGQPKLCSIFRSEKDSFILIFGLLLTAAATFMFLHSVIPNGFSVNQLPILLFAAFGIGITFGNPIRISALYKKTKYIVTAKGISIYIGKNCAYYKSIWYSDLEKIRIENNKNENGTIYFNSHLDYTFSSKQANHIYYLKSGFYHIENANRVYNLILNQQELALKQKIIY